MQQALLYAEMLDIPFAFSSDGDAFLMHYRTGLSGEVEKELTLNEFPSTDKLKAWYEQWKGISSSPQKNLIEQSYHSDGSGRAPRYYQQVAINRTIEAIVKGQNRILLVSGNRNR